MEILFVMSLYCYFSMANNEKQLSNWMNGGGSGAFEHPDAEEWMLDGYHDPDEE